MYGAFLYSSDETCHPSKFSSGIQPYHQRYLSMMDRLHFGRMIGLCSLGQARGNDKPLIGERPVWILRIRLGICVRRPRKRHTVALQSHLE
jgi:hypothetical protein